MTRKALPEGYRIEFERAAMLDGDICCGYFRVAEPGGPERTVEVRATQLMLEIFLHAAGRREFTDQERDCVMREAGRYAIEHELAAGRPVGSVLRFSGGVLEEPATVREILSRCEL